MDWKTGITAAITAVMLVIAGCGDSAEDDARDVAERFQEALLDPAGEPCVFVHASVAAVNGGRACSRRLRADYRRLVRGSIRVVRVYEDSDITRASIRVERLKLELDDTLGDWRINEIRDY